MAALPFTCSVALRASLITHPTPGTPSRSGDIPATMPKPRKVWMLSPGKIPKPSVPESIKAELAAKAMHLIENVLKPRHVLPPKPNAQSNYVTNLYGKWNRGYFYFVKTYACPGPNAISPSFESKFARLEYTGGGKFSLSYLRHTGTWFQIHEALSVDESLKAIQEDPWFQP